MSALPDAFDVQVRRAREQFADPQELALELVAQLKALPFWRFLNVGTKEEPLPLAVEHEGETLLVLFSGPDRADDYSQALGRRQKNDPLPLIEIPTKAAIPWCLEWKAQGVQGLLVNPGAFGFVLGFGVLQKFLEARMLSLKTRPRYPAAKTL